MFYRHINWHNIVLEVKHFGKFSMVCVHYRFYNWQRIRYHQRKMMGFCYKRRLITASIINVVIFVICCVSLNTEERF